MEVKISADLRPKNTKGYKHYLRDRGKVPAVVYGKGIDSQALEISAKELESAIRKNGRNALLNLAIRGKQSGSKFVVMVKDIQKEPMRGSIVHVDLCKVSLKDKIHAAVPVTLRGDAAGVKAGGVVQAGVRELEIECIPAQIPEAISVDISNLNIGEHISAADLPDNQEYRVLADPETILVTIVAPRMAEQPETTVAAGPVIAPAETHHKQNEPTNGKDKQEGE